MSIQDIISDNNRLREITSLAFNRINKDKSGKIDKNDIKKAMEHITNNLGVAPPSEASLEEVLIHTDIDNTGKIDYDGFIEIVKDYLLGFASTNSQ